MAYIKIGEASTPSYLARKPDRAGSSRRVDSTRVTSAPRNPSSSVAYGPAAAHVKSRTRTPSSILPAGGRTGAEATVAGVTWNGVPGTVKGLFYGGGVTQLLKQLLGSGSTVVATLGISLIMMFALKQLGALRVSKEGDLEGLDLHEHGASAYPEYALAVANGVRQIGPTAS